MNSEYTLIYVKRNGQRNEENGSLTNEGEGEKRASETKFVTIMVLGRLALS